MTDQIDPKEIDRIRKLLALARDGGATEAESNLAMEKAQERMTALNLTMATLEASGGSAEGRVKQKHGRNLMYVWKRELLETIAEVNFCHLDIAYEWTKSSERIAKGYNIIGRISNVVAVENEFEYLMQTIERLLISEVGTSPQDRFNRWSHTFRLGCSSRLRERLKDRHARQLEEQEKQAREEQARRAHPASAPTHNALVVVLKDYAQTEEDLNNDMRRGVAPGTTAHEREARRADREASDRARAEREAALIEEGVPNRIALYMSHGLSRERAEEWDKSLSESKPETEAQRRKREEKDDRQWRRRQEQEYRRQQKDPRHSEGFRRGQSRAEDISLDKQMNRQEQDKLS